MLSTVLKDHVSYRASPVNLQLLIKSFGDRFFGHRSHHSVDDLATFENHQRGDRLNLMLSCDARVFVGVDFDCYDSLSRFYY